MPAEKAEFNVCKAQKPKKWPDSSTLGRQKPKAQGRFNSRLNPASGCPADGIHHIHYLDPNLVARSGKALNT